MHKLIIVVMTVMAFAATLSAQTSDPDAATRPQVRATSFRISSLKSLAIDLTSDLAPDRGSFTKEQKEALTEKLLALVEGGTPPDAALVEVLVDDLGSALSRATLSRKDMLTLITGFQVVMNGSTVSKGDVDVAIGDVETFLLGLGAAKKDVDALVKDLRAIAAQVQATT